MDPEGVQYASARDFERAVVDRLASTAASSPYSVPDLRRQLAFRRLLARVFIHDPDRWVLKGATGLLARLPGQARHSVDVDLYFEGELGAALDAVREIADLDLGEYFTFDLERGTSPG